ncbi:hypothetical protein [Enterococcus sp. DIV0170]
MLYILVTNDQDLSISLHFADSFELSSFYVYESQQSYLAAVDLFLKTILK